MTSRYRSWRYGEDDRLEEQSGSLPGNREWEWDAAGNPLDAGTNAGGPSAQGSAPRRDNPVRPGTDDELPEMWRNLYAAHGLTGEGSVPETGITGEPGRRYVAHNRVTRLGEVEWRYDVHGRVTEKREPGRHLALEWNGEHRLAKVTVTPERPAMPQTVVQFRYDALGRRIEKQVHYVSRNRSWHPVVPLPASYRVRFIWDGLRLVQEIRRDGSTTYVYSDTDSYVPLARIDTPDRAREYTRIYWYHTRPDGTPEQLSDSNGEEVWRIVNDAWGRVDTAWGEINSAAVREDNLRMQGQYLDRETGLHYNLFRYYDADSMHFISPDPIGLAGGLNLYAYAPDPVNWADPWGLTPCKGLPSTRKTGGTGKNYDPVNGQGLYVLHDGKSILYVGRGDATSRLNIHAKTSGKSKLLQLTIFDNNLTKAEAKFLEQRIMDLNGKAQSTNPMTNLLNKIRSYSPNNPNAGVYDIAGHSSDWGGKVLNDALSILKGNGL